ncbi:CHL4 family chromosome segregation protein [Ascosphaera apis ARSEF 7405]|uniref:CHL4 family chromosome segregation protein n=1 Tax=Ascosphaera apis ARSEF 7405 TaxID=392613 RepID=A0A167UZT0_9EURO|nr:CHL4 family chromosome segregation protein [Ascosphaera apis ARSEF 7405]
MALRVPSSSSLPDTLLIKSTTPALYRSFNRLSRPAILSLVLTWLDVKYASKYPPYLLSSSSSSTSRNSRNATEEDEEIDAAYPPANTIEELRGVYEAMKLAKGSKREVIDRVLEGDWRKGISLGQLAMVDVRYLEEHIDGGMKWNAFRIEEVNHRAHNNIKPSATRMRNQEEAKDVALPRIHPNTFLLSLHNQISTLVKPHFHIHRSEKEPVTYIRIFVMNSPFNAPPQSASASASNRYIYTDSARVIYLAFPDSAPFIYASFPTSPFSQSSMTSGNSNGKDTTGPALLGTDVKTLRRLIRDAIPHALSRPYKRYTLRETNLSSRNLTALLALRGPGRGGEGSACGRWSVFAEGKWEEGPVDVRVGSREGKKGEEEEVERGDRHEDMEVRKKRKVMVNERFGGRTSPPASSSDTIADSILPSHRPVLEKFEVHLQDPVSDSDSDDDGLQEDTQPTPATLSLTFSGSDIFTGLRILAEKGVIDAEKMPGYMTGEEGRSVLCVRKGRSVNVGSRRNLN